MTGDPAVRTITRTERVEPETTDISKGPWSGSTVFRLYITSPAVDSGKEHIALSNEQGIEFVCAAATATAEDLSAPVASSTSNSNRVNLVAGPTTPLDLTAGPSYVPTEVDAQWQHHYEGDEDPDSKFAKLEAKARAVFGDGNLGTYIVRGDDVKDMFGLYIISELQTFYDHPPSTNVRSLVAGHFEKLCMPPADTSASVSLSAPLPLDAGTVAAAAAEKPNSTARASRKDLAPGTWLAGMGEAVLSQSSSKFVFHGCNVKAISKFELKNHITTNGTFAPAANAGIQVETSNQTLKILPFNMGPFLKGLTAKHIEEDPGCAQWNEATDPRTHVKVALARSSSWNLSTFDYRDRFPALALKGTRRGSAGQGTFVAIDGMYQLHDSRFFVGAVMLRFPPQKPHTPLDGLPFFVGTIVECSDNQVILSLKVVTEQSIKREISQVQVGSKFLTDIDPERKDTITDKIKCDTAAHVAKWLQDPTINADDTIHIGVTGDLTFRCFAPDPEQEQERELELEPSDEDEPPSSVASGTVSSKRKRRGSSRTTSRNDDRIPSSVEEQVGNGMMVPHAMMAMPASMMAMPTISSRRGIKGGANTMSEYFMQLNERNAQLQNNAQEAEIARARLETQLEERGRAEEVQAEQNKKHEQMWATRLQDSRDSTAASHQSLMVGIALGAGTAVPAPSAANPLGIQQISTAPTSLVSESTSQNPMARIHQHREEAATKRKQAKNKRKLASDMQNADAKRMCMTRAETLEAEAEELDRQAKEMEFELAAS